MKIKLIRSDFMMPEWLVTAIKEIKLTDSEIEGIAKEVRRKGLEHSIDTHKMKPTPKDLLVVYDM